VAVLLAMHPLAQADLIKEHQGHWLGDMKVPDGRVLKIGAELFLRADGKPWASVASPDQGAHDIPVKSIREDGDTVELDISFAKLNLTWDKDHFNGQFIQGGAPLALELTQVAKFPDKVRPQTPIGPFPYKEETLAIASQDGVTLGATLSIPNDKVNPNVVVLVHGSGPATRDASLAGHKTFAVIADHLARQGIAVLRYDKRGIARSTGDYEGHVADNLVDDVSAVVQALKARNQFARVGLIGHSEGSSLAAAAAVRHPTQVDFVVSLAGVGLNGLDAMLLQDGMVAKDKGANPAQVAQLMIYVRQYYEIVIADTEVASRIAKLKALFQGLSAAQQASVKQFGLDQGTLSLGWADKPFLHALLVSDPQPDWRAVRVPVLALGGSLDYQVPTRENLGGIVAALKAGGNVQVESQELPSLNHMFQTAKTGSESEYEVIEETIAPVVLERVARFVGKQK
jgi:hypothetical protein